MKFECISTSRIRTNTYILSAEDSGDCIVIDPGGSFEKINEYLNIHNKNCKYVLITHAHWDHIGAAAELQKKGAKVCVHNADINKINDGFLNGSKLFLKKEFESFEADIILNDGDKLLLCGLDVSVLHTPGHTNGSVCFIIEDNIFSGDTLFKLNAGRTDLPGGSASNMKDSLNKLFSLEKNYNVFPGHGESTSLDFEKINNPYADI